MLVPRGPVLCTLMKHARSSWRRGEPVCTTAQSAPCKTTRLGSRSDAENLDGMSDRTLASWLADQVVSRALRRSFISRNRCNGSVGLASNLARRK